MSITWQERKAFQQKLESYTNEQVLEAYAYERAMHRWLYAAIARVELELRGLKN